MFAIAADDPEAVRRVLDAGVNANDSIGPQSALAFAVGNKGLNRRMSIVKTLLAFGADATSLPSGDQTPEDDVEQTITPSNPAVDLLDPATR